MYRIVLVIMMLLAAAGCKKKHEYEVKIVIEKGVVYRHVLNQPYVEPGAYGLDWLNHRLEVEVDASELNVNKTGSYKVKYKATDEFGNVGTAERTVIVFNEVEYLNGNWSFYKYNLSSGALDTIYIETLTASEDSNRSFFFSRFSNYDNARVKARIEANLLIIDSLPYQVGTQHEYNIWFYGSGLQMTNNRLELQYGEIQNGNTTKFTALVTRE